MTGDRDGRAEDSPEGARIAREADRMDRARRAPARSVLRHIAMFGVVGWTVAIPTIGGVFLGRWFDRLWPAEFSWTLTLLVVGAVLGAALAWRWLARER